MATLQVNREKVNDRYEQLIGGDSIEKTITSNSGNKKRFPLPGQDRELFKEKDIVENGNNEEDQDGDEGLSPI